MSFLNDITNAIYGNNSLEPKRKDIKRKPVKNKQFRSPESVLDKLIAQEIQDEHNALVDYNEYLHSLQSDG